MLSGGRMGAAAIWHQGCRVVAVVLSASDGSEVAAAIQPDVARAFAADVLRAADEAEGK